MDMDFINKNKVNLLLGVCVILLIAVVYLIATGNGANNGTLNNSTEVEFNVSETTISNIKSILADLMYLNTGVESTVEYTSGEMDGEYKVLTFMIGGSNVQEIYVTMDEKSILQAPPISISEMMSELVIAKIQMEEYMKQMENQTETEVEPETIDPLEGTNMSVQDCLNQIGFDGYIFLYSTSCPHCQTMLPIVDELIAEGYNFEKVTSATPGSEKLSQCLSDLSGYVPEFICNTGNKEASHLGGGLTKEQLIDMYNSCGTQ
jgi:thiol-disulfide isomerase/thioredoxin